MFFFLIRLIRTIKEENKSISHLEKIEKRRLEQQKYKHCLNAKKTVKMIMYRLTIWNFYISVEVNVYLSKCGQRIKKNSLFCKHFQKRVSGLLGAQILNLFFIKKIFKYALGTCY